MKRRFRLQSVLDLRLAAEEQQKRRVQLASISLSRSAEAREQAEQWIERSNELMRNEESMTEAEICFALNCIAMSKKAMTEHSVDHRRKVEQFEREIRKLDGDNCRTAIVETLRDQFLKEVRVEERRSEQLSLDESFRLSANSRLGISRTIETQD